MGPETVGRPEKENKTVQENSPIRKKIPPDSQEPEKKMAISEKRPAGRQRRKSHTYRKPLRPLRKNIPVNAARGADGNPPVR